MGCGNSKDDVNTKAQGNVKVGSDKNRNTKNSQVREAECIYVINQYKFNFGILLKFLLKGPMHMIFPLAPGCLG